MKREMKIFIEIHIPAFHVIFISNSSSLIFFYDIILTQTNIGLIPFAYTLRLEIESQGTEVTLTSSKYL